MDKRWYKKITNINHIKPCAFDCTILEFSHKRETRSTCNFAVTHTGGCHLQHVFQNGVLRQCFH